MTAPTVETLKFRIAHNDSAILMHEKAIERIKKQRIENQQLLQNLTSSHSNPANFRFQI